MENYFSVRMDVAEINQMTTLGLAHCGDAVFELEDGEEISGRK